MSSDDSQLVVALEARIAQFERNFARAQSVANRSFGAIERRAQQAGGRMEKAMAAASARVGGSIRNFGVGLLAGVGVREIQQLSDAATRVDNALKTAGLSGAELDKVYASLRDSAIRNAAPLESLVTLYGRAALVQKELGISSDELLRFTDRIALALRVSGQSAAESSGALLQLSQALGSGTVRAEEFNSILEGALPIAQAAAAGLKEAGGSVSKLRQLVVEGKVSSQAFFRAFEAGSSTLEDKVAGSTFTVSQAMSNLYTALIDTAREFNASTGAAENFAGGVNNVATAIADLDVSAFINKLVSAHGALVKFMTELGNADAFTALNQALGLMDADGNVINLDAKAAKDEATALEREVGLLQATIAKNTELGFDNTEALARLNEVSAKLAQVRGELASMPVTVPHVSDEKSRQLINEQVPFNPLPAPAIASRQVSIADFAPPSSKSSSTGGKGGGGSKEKQDDYQREVAQIRERTAAVQAETAAQAGINPLIEDYDFAVTKARAARELLSAAEQAGVTITPELQASIDQLAGGYATATAEANKLADAQDKARDTAQEVGNFSKNALGGFISDLRSGKTETEALANALDKIVDKLIDVALNAAFDGGGFGSLFSGLFGGAAKTVSFGSIIGLADGGEIDAGKAMPPVLHRAGGGPIFGPGGPRDDKVPVWASDGEFMVNAAATKKNRALLEAINSGRVPHLANGGPVGRGGGYMRGGSNITNTTTFAPKIDVKVEGGSRGPEADRAMADGLAKQIDSVMDEKMAKFMWEQMRPGNALNRGVRFSG